jgi:hypothetical protein
MKFQRNNSHHKFLSGRLAVRQRLEGGGVLSEDTPKKKRFAAMRARSMKKLLAIMKRRDAERGRRDVEKDERTDDTTVL